MPNLTEFKVIISYIPDPTEKNRTTDHLLAQWAAQEVRIAVNRWLYSQD